jgi:hypothetical protein
MLKSQGKFFVAALAFVFAIAVSFQPQSASAGSRGLIAGAIVGGVAAAIVAGAAANQPRHVRVRNTSAPRKAASKGEIKTESKTEQANAPAGSATAARAQSDGPAGAGGDKFGSAVGSSLAN